MLKSINQYRLPTPASDPPEVVSSEQALATHWQLTDANAAQFIHFCDDTGVALRRVTSFRLGTGFEGGRICDAFAIVAIDILLPSFHWGIKPLCFFVFFASNLGRRKKSKQKTALSLATVHIHIIIIIWKLKWWQWGGGLRLPDAELISGSGNERTNALLVYTVDEHFRIESGLIQFQLTVKVSENSFLCYIPECF